MKPFWNLDGYYALISGGSKGIGAAVAETLSGLGAKVVVIARNNKELQQKIQQWKKAGKNIQGICADLSKPNEAQRVLKQYNAIVKENRLDILVNNVGVSLKKPFSDIAYLDYNENMKINIGSIVQMCQAFHPQLKQSTQGCVVNTASINAYRATLDDIIGGAYRAAVVSLTKSLAKAWAHDGIRVNAVAPGYTDTDRVRAHNSKETLAEQIKQIPLKRMADPKEIAETIAFLAMPASGYITGQCIIADGGLLL